MAVSATHNGWYYDIANAQLEFYYRGTKIGNLDASGFDLETAMTSTANITLSGAGTDFVSASGNVQLGNPGTFATTQPQGAVVMGGSSLNGIAPVGAITTAGAVFASDTVVRKIIAAGTASNVET